MSVGTERAVKTVVFPLPRVTIPRRETLDARDGDGFKLVRRRLIFDQAMMAASLPKRDPVISPTQPNASYRGETSC